MINQHHHHHHHIDPGIAQHRHSEAIHQLHSAYLSAANSHASADAVAAAAASPKKKPSLPPLTHRPPHLMNQPVPSPRARSANDAANNSDSNAGDMQSGPTGKLVEMQKAKAAKRADKRRRAKKAIRENAKSASRSPPPNAANASASAVAMLPPISAAQQGQLNMQPQFPAMQQPPAYNPYPMQQQPPAYSPYPMQHQPAYYSYPPQPQQGYYPNVYGMPNYPMYQTGQPLQQQPQTFMQGMPMNQPQQMNQQAPQLITNQSQQAPRLMNHQHQQTVNQQLPQLQTQPSREQIVNQTNQQIVNQSQLTLGVTTQSVKKATNSDNLVKSAKSNVTEASAILARELIPSPVDENVNDDSAEFDKEGDVDDDAGDVELSEAGTDAEGPLKMEEAGADAEVEGRSELMGVEGSEASETLDAKSADGGKGEDASKSAERICASDKSAVLAVELAPLEDKATNRDDTQDKDAVSAAAQVLGENPNIDLFCALGDTVTDLEEIAAYGKEQSRGDASDASVGDETSVAGNAASSAAVEPETIDTVAVGSTLKPASKDAVQEDSLKTCDFNDENDLDAEEDDVDWNIMLMQLKEYRVRFGNLKVPEPDESQKTTKQDGWYEVYVWVRNQRERYRHGVLREDRRQKLLELGLEFDPRPIHVYTTSVKGGKIGSGKKQKTAKSSRGFLVEAAAKLSSKSLPNQLKTHPELKLQRSTLTMKPKMSLKSSTVATPTILHPKPPVQMNIQAPQIQQLTLPGQIVPSARMVQPQMPGQMHYQMNQVPAPWGFPNQPVQQPFQVPQYQPIMPPPVPQMPPAIYPHFNVAPPQFNLAPNQLQPQPPMSQQHVLYQNAPAAAAAIESTKKMVVSSKRKSSSSMKPSNRKKAKTSHNATSDESESDSEKGSKSSRSKVSKKHKPGSAKKLKARSKDDDTSESKDSDSDDDNKSSRSKQQSRKKAHRKKDWIESSEGEDSISGEETRLRGKEVSDESEGETGDEAVKSDEVVKKDQPELRTGYFTPEENEYCIAVIQDFKRGYLNTIQGQTISTYLAKKLGCKVLRIQKKYPALLHLKPFRLVKMNGQDDIEQEVEDARENIASLYKKCIASFGRQALQKKMKEDEASASLEEQTIRAKMREARILVSQGPKHVKPPEDNIDTTALMKAQNQVIAQQQQENQALRTVVLQQQFQQAQSNHLLRQQAFQQAKSLIEKAQQCQAAAYARPVQIPNPKASVESFENDSLLEKAKQCQAAAKARPVRIHNPKASVENFEKDIAAETLCRLKGKK